VNTVSDRVVRHSLDYLSVQKWFVRKSIIKHENFAETNQLPP